jgi:hypothetical protein
VPDGDAAALEEAALEEAAELLGAALLDVALLLPLLHAVSRTAPTPAANTLLCQVLFMSPRSSLQQIGNCNSGDPLRQL